MLIQGDKYCFSTTFLVKNKGTHRVPTAKCSLYVLHSVVSGGYAEAVKED